jgi:hypothetical protein
MKTLKQYLRTSVALLAITPLLGACNDNPRQPPTPINQTDTVDENAPVYNDLASCMESYTEQECREYELVAETEHEKTAPRFDSVLTCEQKFGPGHCETKEVGGHSVVIPAMMGFAIGAALGAAAGHAMAHHAPPRPIYYGVPQPGHTVVIYSGNRDMSRYYTRPLPPPPAKPYILHAPPPPPVVKVAPAANYGTFKPLSNANPVTAAPPPPPVKAAAPTPTPTPAANTAIPAAAPPRVAPAVPAPLSPAAAPVKTWAPPVVKEAPPAPPPVTATQVKPWSAPAVQAPSRPAPPPAPVVRPAPPPPPPAPRPAATFSRPTTTYSRPTVTFKR